MLEKVKTKHFFSKDIIINLITGVQADVYSLIISKKKQEMIAKHERTSYIFNSSVVKDRLLARVITKECYYFLW